MDGHPSRKYYMNERYFECIDQADKAYWLGFISADGNLSKTSNTMTLALKRSDRQHLNKLVKCLESNYVVKDFTNSGGSKQSIVTITSAQMKQDLMSYGIVPAKSMVLKPAELLNYCKDFWRGCVDGDGSIMKYYKNEQLCWGISLVLLIEF